MRNGLHSMIAKLRGKNSASTPVPVLQAQMTEPRPLPLGVKEFDEWSDRIIAGAMIPGATAESQKFALAEMIMHAKPTESCIADGYFIQCLRKTAANQIAFDRITYFKDKQRADALKAKEEAEALKAQEAAKPALAIVETPVAT